MKKLLDWLNYSTKGFAVFVVVCWIVAFFFFVWPRTLEKIIDTIAHYTGLIVAFVLGLYALLAVGLAIFGTLILIVIGGMELQKRWRSSK